MDCGACNNAMSCNNRCPQGDCKVPCLQWGLEGCYLRGRCPDGSELNPLDLCDWLKHHETDTSFRLVPNGEECSYIEYKSELATNFPDVFPPYRVCVCDILKLAELECIKNVYDNDGVEPDHCALFTYYNQPDDGCNEKVNHKWHAYSIPLVSEENHVEAPKDFDDHYKVLALNDKGCIEERYIKNKVNFFAEVVQFTARPGDPDDNNIYWQNIGSTLDLDLRPTNERVSPFATDEKDPNWVAPVDMVCIVSFCTNVHTTGAGNVEVDTSAYPSNMSWSNEIEMFNSAHPTWQCQGAGWWASHSTLQFKVPKGSYGRIHAKSVGRAPGQFRVHSVRCTYIPAEIGF